MPVDPMDDIELRSVQLQFPNARGSILEACEQRRVPTDKGDVHVAIQGDTSKPAIVTYHDLGLNCKCSISIYTHTHTYTDTCTLIIIHNLNEYKFDF